MIIDIPDFPHYSYDTEKEVVLSTYEKNKKGELLWTSIQGKPRVTLWRNKNPHYKFKNQILVMIGKEVPKVKKQKQIKKQEESCFEQEVNENDVENELNKDIDIDVNKWGEVEKFLTERQKPFRKDQFQNKFGKEFLEKCLEANLLEEEKIGNFKFYNLKK